MKRTYVQSSIVIPIETKSRNDTISEQKKSEKKEDAVRNQRLFGNLLMGTLNKFRKEEKTVAPKTNVQIQKQMEIEKRLEETREEERERIYLQKQEMIAKRREEEVQVKRQRYEKAIELNAKEKEDHFRRLRNFIQTQAKPPIFYLPATHTPETEKLLEESTKSIDVLIEKLKEDNERQLKGQETDEDDVVAPGRLSSKIATNEDDDMSEQNGASRRASDEGNTDT